jgi:hypothetical protein
VAPGNENELQEQFFAWTTTVTVGKARRCLRDFVFAIPNGMHVAGDARKRAIYVAALKRQGLTPGVSDIFVSLPNEVYHGLYLELKFGNNPMSAEQVDFQDRMSKALYAVGEARTLERAKEIVGKYLNL